ncbi:MAG: ABC transporter transmembrane domain-containing protein, partial [Gammaproteobacteria bacterium]
MSGVQSNAKLKHVSGSAEPESPLLDCLHTVTRLHAKPISKSALLAGVPLPDGQFGPAEFVRAAEAHGYSAKVTRRRLSRISPLLLPVTLLMNDGSACVLTAIKPRQVYEVIFPEADFGAKEISAGDLADSYSGFALFAQPELAVSQDLNSPLERKRWSWFWGTLAAYFPYYIEALIAGVIVNVLTIASALYIMNVYDRVVPNNAFETLIVLAVGTATAIVFEFCARTLRAYFLDAAGRRADVGLASQIFAQAMGLSMISRPTSTGAFAAQLREFESVREFITSATLTAVMDIPFVLFFIFIVSLIGGPLYLIPAGALPLILIVGLIAQFPLAIVMKRNLEEIARRHGLLIESLEGVETLKANRGESQMLGKYEDYTALSSRSACAYSPDLN